MKILFGVAITLLIANIILTATESNYSAVAGWLCATIFYIKWYVEGRNE